jgi:hypothetical protein
MSLNLLVFKEKFFIKDNVLSYLDNFNFEPHK